VKQNLTAEEYYRLQWLKAKEALVAERLEGTKQEARLLDAVAFMAGIAKTATNERTKAAERAQRATSGEIQNLLMEFGLERKAAGGLENWSVALGAAPETTFFVVSESDEDKTGPHRDEENIG